MLSIADSGTNIHLSKQGTTETAPVTISNEMIARLLYGITKEYSNTATLHLPGLIKQ